MWHAGNCLDGNWQRRGAYCYRAFCHSVTQKEAQQLCNEYSQPNHPSALASIQDRNEGLFLAWLARSLQTQPEEKCHQRGMWIGLTAEDGKSEFMEHIFCFLVNFLYADGMNTSLLLYSFPADWYWKDGTSLHYTGWDVSEPNNQGGKQCVHLIKERHLWNDEMCNELRDFICKMPVCEYI